VPQDVQVPRVRKEQQHEVLMKLLELPGLSQLQLKIS
jgi:hypothetical protein